MPLSNLDDDDNAKRKHKTGGKIGENAVILEESELSDEDEEEVVFSDTEFGFSKS